MVGESFLSNNWHTAPMRSRKLDTTRIDRREAMGAIGAMSAALVLA
jgi:hypothetical protein